MTLLSNFYPSSRAVLITGNQNISGVKNFQLRPTVFGTGVLISGEATRLPETIVYTTGNQTIEGNKTFIGSGVLTGARTPLIITNTDSDKIIRLGNTADSFDLGTQIYIESGYANPVVISRGGIAPSPYGYAIVFGGGQGNQKKGYLTVGNGPTPTGLNSATLVWTDRILSGQWRTNRKLLVNDIEVVLSGEAISPFVDINNITDNFSFNSGWNSKLLTVNASQNITGAVPTGLPTGYNVSFVQIGNGSLFITGSGGALVRHRLNLYNTAGQYAIASLLHHSGNQFILYGDLV